MRQPIHALFAGLLFAAPTYASDFASHQFRQSAQAPTPVASPPAPNQSFIPFAASAFQAPDPGPDPNSDSVGAIAGQYQVDASGAATYSVPLYVPTGSANMQPTVALNYSSRAPNGPLGMGWSIGGLSVISRCKQGVEFGDSGAPFAQPNFDGSGTDDAYCLDGARLLAKASPGLCPASGVSAGNVQAFGVELDTTTVVCGYKPESATTVVGFGYWLVLPADGSIRRYGFAGSSGLPRNINGTTPKDANHLTIVDGYLSWSIDRMADRSGNAVDYTYLLDAANGELEIAHIDYTSKVSLTGLPAMGATTRTPFARVLFNYDAMPLNGQRIDYLAGMRLALTKRLGSITVSGPDNINGDVALTSTTVRTYHLNYTDSSTSGLSTLTSLQECAPNTVSSGELCYPATQFAWNSTKAPGFTNETYDSPTPNPTPFANMHDFKVGNVSGNGSQTVVFLEDRSCGPAYTGPRFRLIATALESGLMEPVGTAIDYTLDHTTRAKITGGTCPDLTDAHLENTWALYDLDGDGRDDLIVLTATQGWVVYYSHGSLPGQGFGTTAVPLGIPATGEEDGRLVDVFGDGLPAFVHGLPGTYKARRMIRGGSAYAFASSDTPMQFDAPTDQLGALTVKSVGLSTSNARVLAAADIDGNGAADFIMRVQLSDDSKRWYVYRNLGLDSGHIHLVPDEDLEPPGTVPLSDDGNDVQFVDFGGNGQAGVMYQVPVGSSQEIHYRLNIGKPDETAGGSRFDLASPAVLTLPTARAKRVQVMDINQDHKLDLVYFDYDSAHGQWPLLAKYFGVTGTGTQGFGAATALCTVGCLNTINADVTQSLFIDINGDGQVALFRLQGPNSFGTGDNTLMGTAVDTIATITNGFSAKTQITYGPLTSPGLYTRSYDSSQLSYGRGSAVFDVLGPYWVVGLAESSAPTDDASSGQATASTTLAQVSYRYASARMQSGGRGFLGFGSMTTTDLQAIATKNIQTVTSYYQNFPFIGRPSHTQVFQIDASAGTKCDINPNSPGCQPCNPCNRAPTAPASTPILLTDSEDIWQASPAFSASGAAQSMAIYRSDSNEQHFDATTLAFSHGTDTQIAIDGYGNALNTYVTTTHHDVASNADVTDETLTTTNIYGCSTNSTTPPTLTRCAGTNLIAELQRLGRLSISTVVSARSGETNSKATKRRASFEYDATTYQLISEIQGPYDDIETDGPKRAALGSRTDYTLDDAGNRIQTVQCDTADFANRSACINLAGFTQQQLGSLTRYQRYSKTKWETLGRFPLYTKAPFYSASAVAGNEQVSQFIGYQILASGEDVYRDRFGNPINALDANTIPTYFYYGVMGRKYLSSSFTGAFSSASYTWCKDATPPLNDIPAGAPRANCPAAAVYRLTDSATDTAAGVEVRPIAYTYFDALGRAMLKTTRVYQANGTVGHWSSVATVHDAEGRTIKTTVPYFSVDPTATQSTAATRSGYPSAGINPLPAAEKATYDPVSRPLDESHPEASSDTVSSYKGTNTTVTNPRQFTSTVSKNGRAEVIRMADPESLAVSYTKGAFGSTTQVSLTPTDGDSAGLAVTAAATFDSLGRRIQVVDPDKGTWNYAYNALGEVVSQTDAKGQVHQLYRDALGRQILRTELRADGSNEQTSAWIYDITVIGPAQTRIGPGLLSSESNGVNGYSKSMAYDPYGRVSGASTTLTDTASTTYVESQSYDDYSRLLTHIDPSATGGAAGETIGYSSDGFAIAITDAVGGGYLQQLLAMTARGQSQSEQFGGLAAMKTLRTFDPITGRLLNVSTGTGLQNLTYTYDKHDNLLSRLNAATDFSNPANHYNQQENFSYDSRDRLTSQTLHELNGVVLDSPLLTLGYDGLGNITDKSGIGHFSYATRQSGCANAAGVHAVTLAGTSQRYCYDANGNQIAALGPTARTISYTSYDLPDEIVQTAPTTTEIDFKYAPDRSLWKRTDGVMAAVAGAGPDCPSGSSDRIFCNGFETGSTATVPPGSGGTPTYYVGNIEVIGTGSSATIKRYVGSFLVVTTTPSTPAGVYNYLFKDSIGSIDVIADANGNAIQRESFDPHGMRRGLAPTTSSWAVLSAAQLAVFPTGITRESFTGHWGLEAVGLIHMKGRLYDATLGRFIQADPFTERDAIQGLNRYSYVLNNPLSLTDPTGYLSFDQAFGIAIGLIAGVASGGLYNAGLLWASFGVAVGGGFLSAWVGSGFNANAGLWGAFAAGVFWGIGTAFQQVGQANRGIAGTVGNTSLTVGQFATKVALHGVAGGVLNSLRGANFGNGFWAAGATEALSPEINKLGGNSVGRVTLSAIVGGTVSAATGGKFANGAETAMFQTEFSEIAQPGASSGLVPDEAYLEESLELGPYSLADNVVLFDTTVVGPFWHTAKIVGSDDTGWLYYSKDDVSTNTIRNYSTLADFDASETSKRYDLRYRISQNSATDLRELQ